MLLYCGLPFMTPCILQHVIFPLASYLLLISVSLKRKLQDQNVQADLKGQWEASHLQVLSLESGNLCISLTLLTPPPAQGWAMIHALVLNHQETVYKS